MNIQIVYLPQTTPNYAYTVLLEKFRILDFIHYRRVLYMDADVMPFCILDYLNCRKDRRLS
jgi:alpha-N-acetylglucosamine transferase